MTFFAAEVDFKLAGLTAFLAGAVVVAVAVLAVRESTDLGALLLLDLAAVAAVLVLAVVLVVAIV